MSSLLMGVGFGGVGRGKVWLVVVVRGGEGLALTHAYTFLLLLIGKFGGQI